MLNVLLTASVSFLVSFFAIPAIIRVAKEKKLFDLPDARKLHSTPIASLGGVGIFLGFFLSCLLTTTGKYNTDLQFFFASAIVVFFIGLKDDILVISAVKKFLGQIAAAAILIHLGNVRLDGLYGFFGVHGVPEPISLLLSYVTIIVVVNAYNLIDGVDGLAGSLGVLTTVLFGTYFLLAGKPIYSTLAFGMAGSLLGFLMYNFSPAKIFMGDSGSLLLGLMNAVLVVKFISTAAAPDSLLPLASPVAIGFSILVIPLLDTLRVFAIRIVRGRSPFAPDRNHIHHLLLDQGLNHRHVTLTCVGLNFAFIAMAYLGRSFGSTIIMSLMFALATLFMGALMYFRKAKRTLVISTSFQRVGSDTIMQPTSKVVPIKNEAAVAEH